MNRREKTIAAAYYEQLAEQVTGKSRELRNQLRADAVAEFAENGGAPTWRYDVGTVSLAISKESVEVCDEAAFRTWVGERYPEELVQTVRASWQTAFLERARQEADTEIVADPHTGEVIPGVRLKPGGEPKHLTVRVDAAAKEVLAMHAAAGLKHLEIDGNPAPVVLAEIGQADA